MNTKDVVSKFDSLINRLEQSKEKFSIHPEKDFSRNRKISLWIHCTLNFIIWRKHAYK